VIYEGNAHCFGDDINTDYITPGKYKSQQLTFEQYATHIMEDIDPGFYERINKGDFIVAGENFGCGSSRESAPRIVLAAGISAVLAKSFARIFFRNAISLGLPLIECDTDAIIPGEKLVVDVVAGTVTTEHGVIQGKPLPSALMKCLLDGGMLENFKKYGTFTLD